MHAEIDSGRANPNRMDHADDCLRMWILLLLVYLVRPDTLNKGGSIREIDCVPALSDLPEVRLELTSLSAVDFESAAFTISPLRREAIILHREQHIKAHKSML